MLGERFTWTRLVIRLGWPGVLVWLAGWCLLMGLDGHLDLANQALVLVLLSAIAALWLHAVSAMVCCALAVMAFNYQFVPPRGTFTVDLHQHMWLLAAMLVVSWIVSWLMSRQQRLTEQARQQAKRAQQLRELAEQLRAADASDPMCRLLQAELQTLTGLPVCVMWHTQTPSASACIGQADAHVQSGLALCATMSAQMGPGTGRHEEQPAWYLPLRASQGSLGAVHLALGEHTWIAPWPDDLRWHAQAMCDLLGVALERLGAAQQADAARQAAQTQSLRSTLLAAIAHDHRTPLATILGAASSLHDQADRLTPQQQRQLASVIVDEAQQLARLTDNTLQLARLDAPQVLLHLDWESIEEIIGTVVRRARQRDAHAQLRTHLDDDLPLLTCDAVLLVQLLGNLVENAMTHGTWTGQVPLVDITAQRMPAPDARLRVAVEDRGPGMEGLPGAQPQRRGTGLGLAVCQAIARVHEGQLNHHPRPGGGTTFELLLPVRSQPEGAEPVAGALTGEDT